MKEIVSGRLGPLSASDTAGEGFGRRGGRKVTVAGLVMAVARRNTQRGAMASVLLDDKTGRLEATLFNEAFEQYRDLLLVDSVLVIEGNLHQRRVPRRQEPARRAGAGLGGLPGRADQPAHPVGQP